MSCVIYSGRACVYIFSHLFTSVCDVGTCSSNWSQYMRESTVRVRDTNVHSVRVIDPFTLVGA